MNFQRIPLAALGPIAVISCLILLIAFLRSSSQPMYFAPSSAVMPVAAPEVHSISGQPTATPVPLEGQYTQRSALNIISADGLYSADAKAQVAGELEQALQYVSLRFASGLNAPISAYIGWDANCNLHGIAYTLERTTQVFTCPSLPSERMINIMAHEFVHQLAHDRYGDRHLSTDMILLEGLATWGAGSYWLGSTPSFAAFMRPIVEGGGILPLATSYVGRSIADMNTLYYEWGSFVEFLIEVYGREAFDRLYVTGSSSPGSADYQGVYGKPLAELEREWQQWVLSH